MYLLVAAMELDAVLFSPVAESGLVLCKAPIWLAWQTVRLVHSLAVASAWVFAYWEHIARLLLCMSSGLGSVVLLESAPQHLLAYWLECIISLAAYEHSLVSRIGRPDVHHSKPDAGRFCGLVENIEGRG